MNTKNVAMLMLSFLFLPSCGSGMEVVSPSISDSSVVENIEGSQDHSKIYLYTQGNVPYDHDNDTRDYLFLTPYLSSHPTGGAVLVFPGGGYSHLSNSTSSVPGYGQGVDNEGEQRESSDIAEWYNQQGISVFVVNYRTKALDPNLDYHQLLADATRSVKYIRYHAKDYYLNPNEIAVQGYSAGGESGCHDAQPC